MRVWVDVAVQLLTDSPTAIAEESGLDRGSWYDWIRTPGFEDWYYTEYKKKRHRILPTLDKIGMKYANKGSFQHWETMNKKIGDTGSDYDGEMTIKWKRPD